MSEYIYLGDRFTDLRYKKSVCSAVRVKGKCIRGKNGNMLVEFNGEKVVVVARLLRKVKNPLPNGTAPGPVPHHY